MLRFHLPDKIIVSVWHLEPDSVYTHSGWFEVKFLGYWQWVETHDLLSALKSEIITNNQFSSQPPMKPLHFVGKKQLFRMNIPLP